VQANASWFFNQGAPVPRIDIQAGATLVRRVGTGTATLQTVFDNAGTVDVQTGTLTVNQGGTETGVFAVTSGATLDFPAGAFTWNSGAAVTGSRVTFSGGTHTINVPAGDTTRIARLAFTAGTVTGTGVLAVSADLVSAVTGMVGDLVAP